MIKIDRELYDAVATISAYSTISTGSPPLVKPGCFLFDTSVDVAKRKVVKTPNEFPNIRLDIIKSALIEDRKTPLTFGMNSVSFSSAVCNIPVSSEAVIRLMTTYPNIRMVDQTNLEAAIDSFLMSKFPKFGLQYVSNFSVVKSRVDEKDPELTQNAPRTITRRLITFNLRVMLAQFAP